MSGPEGAVRQVEPVPGGPGHFYADCKMLFVNGVGYDVEEYIGSAGWFSAVMHRRSLGCSDRKPKSLACMDARVAAMTAPGRFRVIVKNSRLEAVFVAVWIRDPVDGGYAPPAGACSHVHELQSGTTIVWRGFSKELYPACLQDKAAAPFRWTEAQRSRSWSVKIKCAAYRIDGYCAASRPLSSCSIYVGEPPVTARHAASHGAAEPPRQPRG
jgi:hypothetical protein